MDKSQLREYFLSKKAATEDFPFAPDCRVFKVCGKMFGLVAELDKPLRINLKCDPDEAVALRDIFVSVIPGYHMSKRHWNTIVLEGDVPVNELKRMIDNSYQLVINSLTKKQKKALEAE